MIYWLSSPLLAYVVCIYTVAIIGEFYKQDGMMTQEYVCVWIGILSVGLLRKIKIVHTVLRKL